MNFEVAVDRIIQFYETWDHLLMTAYRIKKFQPFNNALIAVNQFLFA